MIDLMITAGENLLTGQALFYKPSDGKFYKITPR